MNLSNTAVSNIKGVDYYCINSRNSKSGGIRLVQSIDLTKKRGAL